ncbi:MAG: ABC transporter permease [Bacteroidales bacterium]
MFAFGYKLLRSSFLFLYLKRRTEKGTRLSESSYTVIKRTKEIGIRKVLGTPVARILWMLLADISKWVLLANIIAWPLAYYFMNGWLNHFAYKINMHIWMFIAAACIAFIIAMITVIVLAYRAASANPANALRYE